MSTVLARIGRQQQRYDGKFRLVSGYFLSLIYLLLVLYSNYYFYLFFSFLYAIKLHWSDYRTLSSLIRLCDLNQLNYSFILFCLQNQNFIIIIKFLPSYLNVTPTC